MAVNLTNQTVNINNWTAAGDGKLYGLNPSGLTDGVSGTIDGGGSVVISGTGFSTGPTNFTMNHFDSGSDGVDITTLNTNFDAVSAVYIPTFTTDARSFGLAADSYKLNEAGTQYANARMDIIPGGTFTEVFVSFARKIPTGKNQPHDRLTRTVTGVTVANPSVLTTSVAHKIAAGETHSVTLSGFTTTPDINGVQTVTGIDSTTFSIPINVTSVTDGSGSAVYEAYKHSYGFYTGSDDKLFWLMNEGTSNSNDIVLPTHIGNGDHQWAGNDLPNKYDTGAGAAPPWWNNSFPNNFYRYTTWMQAGAMPEIDAGKLYINVCNAQDTMWEHTDNTDVTFLGGNTPYVWKEGRFTGWMVERLLAIGSDNIQVITDDCYMAWGTNAAARVEIGNAATYTACTDLAICPSTSWADTSITVTLPDGPLSYVSDLWLFVFDELNSVIATYKIV